MVLHTLTFLAAALAAAAFLRLSAALLRRPWVGVAARRAFLTRFGWLSVVVPLALFAAGRWFTPDLLGNLFVVADGAPFAAVGFLAVIVATAARAMTLVAVVNAPYRYSGYREIDRAARSVPAGVRLPGLLGFGRNLRRAAFRYLFLPGRGSKSVVAHWSAWVFVLGYAAALSLGCVVMTDEAGGLEGVPVGEGARDNATWAATGMAVAVAALAGLAALSARLFRPVERVPHLYLFEFSRFAHGPRTGPLRRVLLAFFSALGPGYLRPGRTVFRRGHGPLVLLTFAAACGYAGGFAAVASGLVAPTEERFPPAATVLFLVSAVGTVLGASAFYLDYHRIPVLVSLAAWSALLFLLNGTDHYYEVAPAASGASIGSWLARLGLTAAAVGFGVRAVTAGRLRQRAGGIVVVSACLLIVTWGLDPGRSEPIAQTAETPTVADLSSSWKFPPLDPAPPRPKEKVLVVVAASGGGIQASAWAARVLTGLHERYGVRFTRSVGLVSAVSGGGLGTAAYLNQWRTDVDVTADPFDDGAGYQPRLDRINAEARKPGLAAVAWGLAGPDTLRFALPPAAPDHVDRGWALAENWRAAFRRPDGTDWRLKDVAAAARAGKCPAVVFNATLSESGRRFLIGSNTLQKRPSSSPDAVEFLHVFPNGEEMPVSTAVRLTASFPYASPISRARPGPYAVYADLEGIDPRLHESHVVDGGYVDNGGVATAAGVVGDLLREYFPPDPLPPRDNPPFDRVVLLRILPFAPDGPVAYRQGGWGNELVGPVTALENVRTTSQIERNKRGVELLRMAYPNRVIDVPFTFLPDPAGGDPPLSWNLTRRQAAAVDDAWARHLRKDYRAANVTDPFQELDKVFGAP